MLLKIVFKLYEFLLRSLGTVNISFFCKSFDSADLPISQSIAHKGAILHVFIPYRDRLDLTQSCLLALFQQNCTEFKVTVHLIDNASSVDTRNKLQLWLKSVHRADLQISLHQNDEPFNFSKLCNTALTIQSSGQQDEFFLFLNNDVVLEDPNSLRKTVAFACDQVDCGAIGITLLFSNGRIQHIFAAPGVKIIAGHPFKGKSASILTEWKEKSRQVPAVTGAFLLVDSRHFRQVGGFDENLPTAGQDIDLCLKLQKLGLKNWVIPQVQAVHMEGASRGRKGINAAEVEYIYGKWKAFLTENPAYPAKISRWSEQPAFTLGEGRYPYRLMNLKN